VAFTTEQRENSGVDGAVRRGSQSDLPTVIDIWVDAFAEDPYFQWIQPDRAQWPEFGSEWMSFIAEACFERGHLYIAESEDAAIAWVPPEVSLLSPDSIARGREVLARHGGAERAGHAFETIVAARAHDLDVAHWTLQYLGVRPASQGRGLGALIVAPGVRLVDDDGLPCGLVSTNPRNVSFYERLGFSVVAEVFSPDHAVALRPMRRPALRAVAL